jgi:hypothetical protein
LRNQGKRVSSGLLLLLAPLLLSCASALPPVEFTNPRFDFAFVQRVAVLPFENLTGDRQAGFRVARLMVSELLATGAVDLVEPGEVISALERGNVKRFTTPSEEEVIALGEALEVEGVIIGSVAQSEVLRLGGAGRVGDPHGEGERLRRARPGDRWRADLRNDAALHLCAATVFDSVGLRT